LYRQRNGGIQPKAPPVIDKKPTIVFPEAECVNAQCLAKRVDWWEKPRIFKLMNMRGGGRKDPRRYMSVNVEKAGPFCPRQRFGMLLAVSSDKGIMRVIFSIVMM
jgi:hypothetical protein